MPQGVFDGAIDYLFGWAVESVVSGRSRCLRGNAEPHRSGRVIHLRIGSDRTGDGNRDVGVQQ